MEQIGKLARRLLAGVRTARLMVLAAALSASATGFGAATPRSEVSIEILGQLGYSVNGATSYAGNTINIRAAIDWLGGLVFDGDVYVGILEPKSERVWTWAVSDGEARLTPGMVPILEDVPLRQPQAIRPAGIVKSALTYTFTGEEQPGLYLVFVMMMKAGADPGPTSNGVLIRMEPLFVIDPP
jgi:hypothetical protein